MQKLLKYINCRKIDFKIKNALIISYTLSVIIIFIVYLSGGTNTVYPNLMYLPISIIAVTQGKKLAIISALINGFLLGPLMPLEITSTTYIMQDYSNWIIRIIMYTIIALVIGFLAEHDKKEFEKNIKIGKELAEAQMSMIYSMIKLSESRDEGTGLHIERVATLCKLLTIKLKSTYKYKDYINNDYVENIYKASPLHDIGKVAIPDRVLLKQGELTSSEFDIMKKHTVIGANTLDDVRKKYPDNLFLDLAINIAHFHHEKWDGTGYPNNLAGEKIPLSARIMALVDVYDALRSKRIYKEAYSHEKSLEIIKQSAGSHFDPIITKIFIENETDFNNIHETIKTDEKSSFSNNNNINLTSLSD